MRKKIFLAAATLLILAMMTTSAFAGVQPDEALRIDDLDELKAAIARGEIDGKNAEAMVTKKTLDQFTEEKNMLASEALANLEISGEDLENGRAERTVDLGDGCYIRVILTDEKDSSGEPDVTLAASTPSSNTLWKDYGDRKFTSTYERWILETKYTMSLCNHYTLGSTGIKYRYGEREFKLNGEAIAGAGAIVTKNISAKTGETISMYCEFKISQSDVIGLYNNVKCLQIDKTNKRVKVNQSWSIKRV